MERVLIISYIISMILMVGFIYCVYREKYWVFEFVNKIKKPIQQLVYVLLMLISSYAYICFSLLIEAIQYGYDLVLEFLAEVNL